MVPEKLIMRRAPSPTSRQKDEEALIRFVDRNLEALIHYANDVSDAVHLFNALRHLTDHRRGWPLIPAKQAIVDIYNYRMAMDAVVTATTRQSKRLKDVVDTPRMEAAKQAFRQLHPHTKELRQTILHQAELSGTEERIRQTNLRKHQRVGIVTFAEDSALQSCLIDDTLQMTFQGKIYLQPINLKMVSDLFDNATEFVGAFSAIGAGTGRWRP